MFSIDDLLDEIKSDDSLLLRLVEDIWQEEPKKIGVDKYRCFCHFHNDNNNPNFTIFLGKDGYWYDSTGVHESRT
jgi:hypothetical protein